MDAPAAIGGYIYGRVLDDNSFAKLDLETAPVWSIPFDQKFKSFGQYRASMPKAYRDGVICYLGCGNLEIMRENDDVDAQFLEGRVCYFAQEDGAIRWNRQFERALEDMVLDGDRIFACTQFELLRICAANGEIEQKVSIPVAVKLVRSGVGMPVSALAVYNSLIFLCYQDESRIWVYDAESLTVKHEIKIPRDYWYGGSYYFYSESTQRLYFGLKSRSTEHFEFNSGAVLEIDPAHYEDAVEVEEGPSVEISVRPAAQGSEKEELWVEIAGSSLDDALRFGEWHLQNATWRQADISTPAFVKDVNPKLESAPNRGQFPLFWRALQYCLSRLCRF